jgi:hypothetical protein
MSNVDKSALPALQIRDQGFELRQHPTETGPADYIGQGTPSEQARDRAQEAAVAACPAHRVVVGTMS